MKHLIMRLWSFPLIAFLSLTAPTLADVRAVVGICTSEVWMVESYDSSCTIHVEIHGTISEGDFEKMKSILSSGQLSESLKTRFLISKTVSLNSGGGSVSEAKKIGIFVRENGFFTAVGKDAKCDSACSLIWLAGIYRVANSEIGIHRPWISAGEYQSLGWAEKNDFYADIRKDLETYLSKLGEDSSIVSTMFSEPSDGIDRLSQTELEDRYNIGKSSTVFEEHLVDIHRAEGLSFSDFEHRIDPYNSKMFRWKEGMDDWELYYQPSDGHVIDPRTFATSTRP